MNKIDFFTNQYSLSKTLRFKLIPQGETLNNFTHKRLLEEDIQRAKDYSRVKEMIDRYHKTFIEKSLKGFILDLDQIKEYADLYWKSGRTTNDTKRLDKISDEMRKKIADHFKKQKQFGGLFKKEMTDSYLLDFLTDEEEKSIVEKFSGFSTYFSGFHQNRKNMYTGDGKPTEIAFRIVDQNLPKFLDNCKVGAQVLMALPKEDINKIEEMVLVTFHVNLADIFKAEYFNQVLVQSGIDIYNQIIGGYTDENHKKIQGLNEYINLHNQRTKEKLPKLKPLFKQILSDCSTLSFLPVQFESDQELLTSILEFYTGEMEGFESSVKETIEKANEIISSLSEYDPDGIYVPSGPSITDISQGIFGAWRAIQDGLDEQYDHAHRISLQGNKEKHLEKRRKYFKSIKSYSLTQLQNAADAVQTEQRKIVEYLMKESAERIQAVRDTYASVRTLLDTPYPKEKKLIASDTDIELIKAFLDALKEVQWFYLMLLGTGKEENRDDLFYSIYQPLCEQIDTLTPLYDRVRNYVTKKPYSKNKIKLNFSNPQFMGGWHTNKESDYSSVLFRKDNLYYLGIMNNEDRCLYRGDKEPWPQPDGNDDSIEKMILVQSADPAKVVQNLMFVDGEIKKINGRKEKEGEHKGENLRLEEAKNNNLPPKVNEIRKKKTYLRSSESFSREDLNTFIDYYKKCAIAYFEKNGFTFTFKESSEYRDFSDFTNDINRQAYQIRFVPTSLSRVNQLVKDGQLFLFQIYNKDFSPYSKGTPNLHTMYFKTLFSEENLANITIALNGGAEIFYRMASLKKEETAIHPANQPIQNKNPKAQKKTSTFAYDVVKNKRYTENQFMLHVPITLNFQAPGMSAPDINMAVRKQLRETDDNYVIGIDRGERNLLYICVIDGEGHIVEQHSLNSIVNHYNGNDYEIDYHSLLSQKEGSRECARKGWKTIETIKELKEGYISQAVYKICQLVEKYDAIIAMEDLNSGFKRSRIKVEKQVYQKFEKMLIEKLNFMVDKKKSLDELGGVLNAYQLTTKFESFAKIQNGFIFYIPAWLTSKIDPTTGFVDLLHPKYKNVETAKEFLKTFDSIYYDSNKDEFVFELDYRRFPRCSADWRKQWKVTSYGDRIRTFRNPQKNNEWDCEEVILTAAFKELFARFEIDWANGDLQQNILEYEDVKREKDFYKKLLGLISLVFQMRNSKTGTEIDYMISPVENSHGEHYDSRNYHGSEAELPNDADANGAYHIARKAQWAVEQIQRCEADELSQVKLAISNAEWLKYVQEKCE